MEESMKWGLSELRVKSREREEEEERVFYAAGIEGMCAKGYLIMDGGIEEQRREAARKGGRDKEGEKSQRRSEGKGKQKKEIEGGRANKSRYGE